MKKLNFRSEESHRMKSGNYAGVVFGRVSYPYFVQKVDQDRSINRVPLLDLLDRIVLLADVEKSKSSLFD